MGIKEVGYVVLSDGRTIERKRNREGWLDILRRWLVECPHCTEVWLVVGARYDDRHVCKEYGHRFAIKFSVTTGDSKSSADVAVDEQL